VTTGVTKWFVPSNFKLSLLIQENTKHFIWTRRFVGNSDDQRVIIKAFILTYKEKSLWNLFPLKIWEFYFKKLSNNFFGSNFHGLLKLITGLFSFGTIKILYIVNSSINEHSNKWTPLVNGHVTSCVLACSLHKWNWIFFLSLVDWFPWYVCPRM